jgi:hypothetical protein
MRIVAPEPPMAAECLQNQKSTIVTQQSSIHLDFMGRDGALEEFRGEIGNLAAHPEDG